jgi:hypothetical protein
MRVGAIDDFTYGRHIGIEITNLATRTIDDFTDGREGALSMTSPMDAKEGEERNDLEKTTA